MPDIAAILDATHEVYTKTKDAWAAEERRLHGGYQMLVELEQFTNETAGSYESRQKQSPLLNFGRIHAGIVIGHLNEVAPTPNYGTLGDVRERKAIPRGQETPAELFHYNANGVGTNGLQFTALSSGIQTRTLATGFRWTMVEMPVRRTRAGTVVADVGPVTDREAREGHRPFVVEYSPRAVPMWDFEDGRLNWAVIRTRHRTSELWTPNAPGKGYYLLVRQGFAGLGDEFAGGGWWLYDPEKTPLRSGTWERTKGEIPLTMYISEESEGTEEYPAVATMPLMELNQLASGLMNRISERNWNARNAAKSQKHILGAEPKTFNEAVELTLAGSFYIPWQPFVGPDGGVVIPTLYDGANGAVESSVYAEIIRSTIEEAHEIMVRQVTSTPDSTGVSKEAGFNEATSPLLSALAIRRETWENTVIPWVEMRAGAAEPSGFVQWPTEFDITPVVAKIDRAVERMTKIGARSPSLESRMVEMAAVDEGFWPTKEAEAAVVREELTASLTLAARETQARIFDTVAKTGTVEGAAGFAMMAPDDVAAITTLGAEGSVDAPVDVGTGAPTDPNAPADPNAQTDTPPDIGGTQPPADPSAPAPARRAAVAGAPPAPNAPAAPAPAPAPDNSEVLARLDALAAQIAALVGAIASKPAEPAPAPAPAPQPPIVLPIQQVPQGKRVTVTTDKDTSGNTRFTLDVQPQPAESPNGTAP